MFYNGRIVFYQCTVILILYSYYPIKSKYSQKHLVGKNQIDVTGYLLRSTTGKPVKFSFSVSA